jgi:hypothetical protein
MHLRCCRFSLAVDGPYLMRDRVGYNQSNMLLPIGLLRSCEVGLVMCMHALFAVHGTVACLQDQNANVWGPYFILEALELSQNGSMGLT